MNEGSSLYILVEVLRPTHPRWGKRTSIFSSIGYLPINSFVNAHIARQQLDKQFNLESPNLRLYQRKKTIADKIVPHISSALRDLGVIFDKYILS